MYIERIENNPYLSETDSENLPLISLVDKLVDQPIDELQTAGAIVHAVNEILLFPKPSDYKKLGLEYPVSLDMLAEKQIANCYGYTLLTSECFERAGIDHRIAMSNGHAFIIKPSENGDLNMFDMPPSRLNGEISKAMHSRRWAGSSRKILETTPALLCAGRSINYDRHPWLGVRNNVSNPRDDKKFLVSLFNITDGRLSIDYYARFCENIGRGNHYQAAHYIHELGIKDLYPDIDARSEDKLFTTMVKGLINDGHVSTAVETVNTHFSALESATNDARFFAKHGDALRLIASETDSLDLAYLAADYYGQAHETSRYPTWDWLNGRMTKLEAMVSKLKN